MRKEPLFFGIRHLSPAGAFHLRRYLDEKKPELVLIEGPDDFDDQLIHLVRQETKPPIAVLAYTQDTPVRTILYPFAAYSPEYQAVLWCQEHHVACHFIDLPSEVFLAMQAKQVVSDSGEEARFQVYEALDVQAGADGQETFWERTLEHAAAPEIYRQGAYIFGRNLRELTSEQGNQDAETIVREAYMSRHIVDALGSGLKPEQIVVVTGAYHVEGLRAAVSKVLEPQLEKAERPGTLVAMNDAEIAALPRVPANHTLMPYSFYRLSSRSGYGAGNKAPAYYGLLWDALCAGEPYQVAYQYLSRIARYQRENGSHVSSAEVIEAVRLASSLARLRGSGTSNIPALRDLRDAAVTCMGGGSAAAISLAVADTEIGTCIGSLPDGVSRTSIQEDFYRQLKHLKLEKYRTVTAQTLSLDLRENRIVKTQKAAFLDLSRSYFLHQLRVLDVSFVQKQEVSQENATWAEQWILRWTPEAEIELVEAALKGDTVAQAASFALKEQVETADGMGTIAQAIEDAFTCGMPAAVVYAAAALQAMAVDAVAVEELSFTASRLSIVLQYGSIRQLDPAPLRPILQQLFFRACLILPGACICDDGGSKAIIEAIDQLNRCATAHDFLDQDAWLQTLTTIAERDDLNTKLSGLAAAVLLERGAMPPARLHQEVQRRLSKGVPADLGAGWFEGLAMKNRYALIARLSLWESLDEYLATLNDEEFKRALVFLRRAFADFTSLEKDEIAENLGEIWGLNQQQVSEVVNAPLNQEAQEMLDSLDDFDFDL